jgi:hypothetical protein
MFSVFESRGVLFSHSIDSTSTCIPTIIPNKLLQLIISVIIVQGCSILPVLARHACLQNLSNGVANIDLVLFHATLLSLTSLSVR